MHNTVQPTAVSSRRGRRRRITAAALCWAGSLVAAGPATAAQMPKDRTISVEMTLAGTHTITWQYADPSYPDPNRAWSHGSGVQTLNVAMSRPLRFKANLISSMSPVFGRLVPLLLVPEAMPQPLSGALSRTQHWDEHDPGVCEREGGCGSGIFVPLPLPPAFCPARNVAVPLKLGAQLLKAGRAPRMGVFAELSGNFGRLWTNCPPDVNGTQRPLALAQPPRVYFTGAIHKMFVMKRGQTVTVHQALRRSAIDGAISSGCSTPLSGAGLHECSVTDLTLHIKRLR